MRRITTWTALAVTVLATGCLHKDTTSTIYLRQDGSLDWVVLERNVRSAERDHAARAAEEADYLALVAADRHAVAESFTMLGGREVRTRLLRDSRPYAVLVAARFDSLVDLLDRELTACGVPHDTAMTRDGDVTTLTLRMDVGVEGEALGGTDTCGDAWEGLLEALDATIVLESGRFTDATGFVVENEDAATFDQTATAPEVLRQNGGRMELSLSWTDAGR